MKEFEFGISKVSANGPAYVIAEIGHNHQGELDKAIEMAKVAAGCGVQAVKLQKRDNKALFTEAYYQRDYDNENSYGTTYGEHREFLEFGKDEYVELMRVAKEIGVEFMSTAFDHPSVDFLEDVGITSYKVASGDVTNLPLLEYIAKIGKPMFVSTGASTLAEVRMAYDTVLKHNTMLVLFHCAAGYPTEYEDLNLRVVETFKREFPGAIIGYSGHDNGILGPVIAYMLGATVVEKHFTLNHAWKGTDHKFSLEPIGLRKQIRDLRRIDLSLGDEKKIIRGFEESARTKMGKSLYAADDLRAGTTLSKESIAIKSPGGGLPPYELQNVIGKKLMADVAREDQITESVLG